jgi:hypothetical protein
LETLVFGHGRLPFCYVATVFPKIFKRNGSEARLEPTSGVLVVVRGPRSDRRRLRERRMLAYLITSNVYERTKSADRACFIARSAQRSAAGGFRESA